MNFQFVIGNHVGLASNVTVCPSVYIGDYAIDGANAVVTHDVSPYAIVGGVPAKVIRGRRFDKRARVDNL